MDGLKKKLLLKSFLILTKYCETANQIENDDSRKNAISTLVLVTLTSIVQPLYKCINKYHINGSNNSTNILLQSTNHSLRSLLDFKRIGNIVILLFYNKNKIGISESKATIYHCTNLDNSQCLTVLIVLIDIVRQIKIDLKICIKCHDHVYCTIVTR